VNLKDILNIDLSVGGEIKINSLVKNVDEKVKKLVLVDYIV